MSYHHSRCSLCQALFLEFDSWQFSSPTTLPSSFPRSGQVDKKVQVLLPLQGSFSNHARPGSHVETLIPAPTPNHIQPQAKLLSLLSPETLIIGIINFSDQILLVYGWHLQSLHPNQFGAIPFLQGDYNISLCDWYRNVTYRFVMRNW